MEYTLSITDEANEEVRQRLSSALSAYNESKAGPSGSRILTVLIRDRAGCILGGLWGSTAYNWFCTHLLIIPPQLRGCGLGSEIMECAEKEAAARGCHSAWLDTFEFQSRKFYERLGYECFGELHDYPAGFSRYFMRKRIQAGMPEDELP